MQFKKKIADEFRQNERPDLKGGVVVIFGDEVSGWMNELWVICYRMLKNQEVPDAN